ncbi:hypothetical protein [Fluviicola sp.]|uniref:hypothetical protein n=1 Tax=Fluviicola sp. TaxID=1917219 RepID=UPI0031DA601C
MSGIHFLGRFVSVFILVGSIASCGLKYVPGPSLDDLEKTRKEKLEEQLAHDFAAVNKTYVSLTYGETVVVKPLSYQRLDSLFEVKYRMSKSGLSTKELDPLIENQKMVLLSDTTEVLYMETHWFELFQDSTYEFVIAQCFLNNKNVLRKMDVVDEFQTGKSNREWAEIYMKEDWLTRDMGYTSNEDLAFYSKMKNKEFSLQGAEKNAFLENVFQVMRIARENKNTAAQGIVLKLAAIQMKKEIPNFKETDYTYSFKKENNPATKQDEYIVEAASISDKRVLVTRKFDEFFMPLY